MRWPCCVRCRPRLDVGSRDTERSAKPPRQRSELTLLEDERAKVVEETRNSHLHHDEQREEIDRENEKRKAEWLELLPA